MEDIESQNRNFDSYKMLHSVKSPSRSGSGRKKDGGDNHEENSFIRLCLKKPETWNWELTTDASTANFDFPKIQLLDENKQILAEVSKPGASIKSSDQKSNLKRSKSSTSSKSRSSSHHRTKKSSSLKLDTTIKAFETPVVNETDEMPSPITIHSERGLLMRDFNAKEFKKIREKCEKLVENQSNPKKDERCSKEQKSPSKISSQNVEKSKRSSSSSSNEQQQVDVGVVKCGRDERTAHVNPKYSLRTCNVGTIIVPKESFSSYPRRRRPRADDSKEIDKNDNIKDDDDDDTFKDSDKVIMDKHKKSDKCSLKNYEKDKGFVLKKSLSSCDVVSDKSKDKRNKKCKSLHKDHTIFLDSENLPTETLSEEENGEFFIIFLFFLFYY